MKRIRRPIHKGNVITRRVQVPSNIELPSYVHGNQPPPTTSAPYAIYKLDSKELQNIKDACKLAGEGRDYAASLVKPGVTTEEIDKKLTDFYLLKKGVFPSPISYLSFPKSLCTSINEVMVHGIPDDRPLEDGDICSLDVSCFYKGMHGDNCITVKCGNNVDDKANKLIKDAKECLDECINLCGPNISIKKIGDFVSDWCKIKGYDTNKDFCGHGIGPLLHMRPLIYHCYNKSIDKMVPGMVFTIEPIIVEGSAEGVMWDDNWTVVTKDGSWAAQNEHTILITDNGCEILT